MISPPNSSPTPTKKGGVGVHFEKRGVALIKEIFNVFLITPVFCFAQKNFFTTLL